MASQVGWLYIDFNSYFASVEQHLDPSLRGKPIAVVPMMADSTCVLAASYEAKKCGIKTGTLVADAKKMCPGIIFKTGGHGEYVRYHKQLIDVIESCHPVSAVCSIDEVACRLRGRDQNLENAKALAQEIKAKIYKNVGESFSCSIGLAPNRFLAKVATDMQKPNGLVTILPEDLPNKLYPLKLRDLIGIGPRMEIKLRQHNIHTIEQLYTRSQNDLKAVWGGVGGERFYQWIRGVDLELTHNSNQSISHSHVLAPNLRSARGARQVGFKLLYKTAVRLRKIQSWSRHLSVDVKHTDGTYQCGELKMLECQDTFTLQDAFEQIWRGLKIRTPIKVTVTLTDLVHDTERTFSFFENTRQIKLSQTMDSLNMRFGRNAVHLGSVHSALDSAPTRIAFQSIPDVET